MADNFYPVFICYKNEGGSSHGDVDHLEDLINKEFNGNKEVNDKKFCFVDDSEGMVGDRFESDVLPLVERCKIFVAVIDQAWLRDANRRENSYVFREALFALSCGKRISPVLLGRDKLQLEDLPTELAELAEMKKIRIGVDRRTAQKTAAAQQIAAKVRELDKAVERLESLRHLTLWGSNQIEARARSVLQLDGNNPVALNALRLNQMSRSIPVLLAILVLAGTWYLLSNGDPADPFNDGGTTEIREEVGDDGNPEESIAAGTPGTIESAKADGPHCYVLVLGTFSDGEQLELAMAELTEAWEVAGLPYTPLYRTANDVRANWGVGTMLYVPFPDAEKDGTDFLNRLMGKPTLAGGMDLVANEARVLSPAEGILATACSTE